MLNQEQAYVFKNAIWLGIERRIIPHKRETESCNEKLTLLRENPRFKSWKQDRIIKVIYLSLEDSPLIGIISQEFGKPIETRKILRSVFKQEIYNLNKYQINLKRIPKGMTWGTCTPFPFTSSMGEGKEISDLIIYDHPSINKKLVDVSVGGDKEGKLASMHLPYEGIYRILVKQFGYKRVHLYDQTI